MVLGGSGLRRAWLRELCGLDEESLEGGGTPEALRLLDRLLVDGPGASVRPGESGTLPVSERDRLLAAVYRATFGPRIEGTLRCAACAASFDLDFDLDTLVAQTLDAPEAPGIEACEGLYSLPDGRRFRLPTGDDECAVLTLPPEEAAHALLRRCCVEGELAADDEPALLEALQQVGPMLNLELTASCPECGHSQALHFDMQAYLLGALAREAESRVYEVHRLALAYGWSLGEILSLSRRRRQAYAALVAGDASLGARGRP
ncbi:hypothetical protein K8638_27225 [Myxococcus sp. RHST-1-4]|nr:hypothetical protein [Myxococcus sp. RHSTA-1-4]